MTEANILVVDDEQFFIRLYLDLLEATEYRVETASSGEEALERIRAGGIDLVMTDMIMPGVDGLEVLRVSRSLENPPDVIMVTGHATTESAIQALKSGARDYITKPFNPDELQHLVHTCLEQRRLLDENSALKTQIQLFQKGQNLASLIDLDRHLPQSINAIVQELGGGRGAAFLYDNNNQPEIKSCIGLSETEGTTLALNLTPVIKEQKGIKFLTKESFETSTDWPGDVREIVILPLICQDDHKGAVVVCNQSGISFDPAIRRENLLFLAEQINLGFENAYRFLGAREMIYTDDLTGLFNHRYLHMALEKEINRSGRYGLKFSVLFIDLDHFKQINDTHGHLIGSKTLAEVARTLKESVREVDTLFRYGGDEFTGLLVETDSEGAKLAAERIRAAIEEKPFLQDEGINVRLTVTIGYATYPDHTSNKFDLINMADQAMYHGKTVRNTIRIAE